MKKNPYDQIIEVFRETNEQSRSLMIYVFEKSDSISLWIIGLGVGAISIFANNIANIQKVIPTESLHTILLLLAISVTSGILYRGQYLYFFTILNQISHGINVALTDYQIVDIESLREGDESFSELVHLLKEGCDIDISYLLETFESLDQQGKEKMYADTVNLYEAQVNIAMSQKQLAVEYVADTYAKYFGSTKEKYLEKMDKNNFGFKYKFFYTLTTISYLIYILSFIAALFSFVFVI